MVQDDELRSVKVSQVRFEHLDEALGIGDAAPRLSWVVETGLSGWQQAAFELEAHTLDGQLIGQTGKVESSESVLVDWPFGPLESRQQVTVRVRVWGKDGSQSGWSQGATVEAGLLSTSDWKARFIRPDWGEEAPLHKPAPLLRREFTLRGNIRQARLYISALGVYEAEINGTRVGDHVMDPGWTSYHHHLRYQTFDVTGLLHEGPNAIGAILGNGWFHGRLGFGGGRSAIYGDQIALLVQLEVGYQDGGREVIVSDESWQAASGPILSDDIYDGETYDARLEQPGWSKAGFEAQDWKGVKTVAWDLATLVAPSGPPIRRKELITPAAILTSPSGKTIVDFGQNLVGHVRIQVSGPAGQTITLRHAEVLEHGELCTRPLRHAKATDHYILRGSKDGAAEAWEPRFTYHGFRYVEVEGWPGNLDPAAICAVVCHSDMKRIGWFECSDPLVNRLHENVIWSMRGNFFGIPTDCPQRDERLGWTGDIQIFSPTASFLYDSAGFLTSWLSDLAVETLDYGVVPHVVPNVLPQPNPPAAAWGDAAVVVPWVLYQRFGDRKVLQDQMPSMRAWVDLIAFIVGDRRLWDHGFQFGDWLDPAAPPDHPADARTPGFIVATAYFARSAELVGQSAGVLGQHEIEAQYLKLAEEVRAAFNQEYVTPAGRVLSDASTAYALALQFALLPNAEERSHAAARLAELAQEAGYHISTGFVGTPLICDALCDAGYADVAYHLLMQRECPSWLYPVTMGATTIWERWDSMLPDGSINPGEMTSFNHYALGAVADWLHRDVAGLAPALPGYRELVIRPLPGGGLSYATARHLTPYGMAACGWQLADGTITVSVEVPPNTTARIFLPAQEGEPFSVGAGSYQWSYPYSAEASGRERFSLASTIADLCQDAELYQRIQQVLREAGMELREGTEGISYMTLREAAALSPRREQALELISQALAK